MGALCKADIMAITEWRLLR